MNTLLTDIEKPSGGGVLPSGASKQEREALALHLAALRGAGHAVVADEVIEDGELRGTIRVTHYLRCMACVGAK